MRQCEIELGVDGRIMEEEVFRKPIMKLGTKLDLCRMS